ncbi:MAG: PKD domain-containing protein [Planctomycetes bacterium]|nr:PKD domain-containing protein [Planctomycetota bacterium]
MSSQRSKALGSLPAIFTTLVLLGSPATLWSQVEWTGVTPNVFGPGESGSWDSTRFRAHTLLKEDESGEYRLWYMGSAVDPDEYELGWQVGCASTEDLEDPLAWSRHEANPCLAFPGPSWDLGAFGLSVLRDDAAGPGEKYKMWYGGTRGGRRISIGYATSPDGLSWTRFSDRPVLEADQAWEGQAIAQPAVVFDGAMYRMWYMGSTNLDDQNTWLIGYATSLDGIEWTKHESNPVLRPGGADSVLNWPHVRFDAASSTFEMWYTLWVDSGGSVRTFGYATSIDGATWVKHPGNPLFFAGEELNRHLSGPVLREGDTYHMLSNQPPFPGLAASYATSPWTIPNASFTVSSQSLTCADEVQVDASRSAAPTSVGSYSWAFGDGTTASGVKASHGYAHPGRYLIQLTVADASSGDEGVAALPVEVACCRGDVAPWTSADIGGPRISGGARLEGSGAQACVAVCAGGSGITGRSDQLHLVYQELAGDATLTARISDLSGGVGLAARAGLMVRETLDPSSRHGAVFAQGSRFRWVSRKDGGGSSRQTSGGTAALPAWLRIERQGDEVIGSSSADGLSWTEVSRQTLAGLAEKVHVGIAATGGDPGGSSAFQALEATFCEIALSQVARFRRGDTDGSRDLTLTDAIALLGYLFLGTAAPACQDAADADDDGELSISDAIFNLGYQFLGTRAPPPPGPNDCGVDPTDDALPSCVPARC